MMKYKTIEIFKGGSLSRTELLESLDKKRVVRKSVSKKENREYGLVRWQSQYKRLQRYNHIFPHIFPKLIGVGHDETSYFFDLEYLEGFVNLKDYLVESVVTDIDAVEIAEKVFSLAQEMHTFEKIRSNIGVFELYLQEECFSKFKDAAQNSRFYKFAQQKKILFNNEELNNLEFNQKWLQMFVLKLKVSSECYTHGNLTLENILFNPELKIFKFIDPYEENIIDCAEADFSQIKQCSVGHYGLIMESSYSIRSNEINVEYDIPKCFTAFNQRINHLISHNLKDYNSKVEDFLYISQFYRMLPFKVQSGNIDQAIVFYGLACKLLQNLRDKYE